MDGIWIRNNDNGVYLMRDFSRFDYSPEQLDLIWDAIREGKQFIDLRKGQLQCEK